MKPGVRGQVSHVVFVGDASSVFVQRTAEALRRFGIDVEVLSTTKSRSRIASPVARLGLRLWTIASLVNGIARVRHRNTVIVHYLGHDLYWIAPLLKLVFKRVVGLAYGSDILRRNRCLDSALGFGMRYLDCIAATNENVIEEVRASFVVTPRQRTCVIRFGLPVFDAIDGATQRGITRPTARDLLGYGAASELICLGYSASKGQRQGELLSFFARAPHVPPGVLFVVPAQYGDEAERDAVVALCKRANAILNSERFLPLTTFHDVETSALMRIATTVLINHSVSDAFSGTVQEVVYAGGLVLASQNLPYSTMPGYGAAIRHYSALEEVAVAVQREPLSAWKQCSQVTHDATRAALRATSSWDAVVSDWKALVDIGNGDARS